jgi:hypothetical protein
MLNGIYLEYLNQQLVEQKKEQTLANTPLVIKNVVH